MKNTTYKNKFPRARVDCFSREYEGEILVYDAEHHTGHCLNPTAAAVWRLCDGSRSPQQIATGLSRQLAMPVEESVVLLALEQLSNAHLLTDREEECAESSSRRAAIRRIGKTVAILLPLVTTIVAPTPASAASCLHNGMPCTTNVQCCSGVCSTPSGHCNGG